MNKQIVAIGIILATQSLYSVPSAKQLCILNAAKTKILVKHMKMEQSIKANESHHFEHPGKQILSFECPDANIPPTAFTIDDNVSILQVNQVGNFFTRKLLEVILKKTTK